MKTPTNPKPRYIAMEFEDACSEKWTRGAMKYRKSAGDAFQGDLVQELYEELLDAHNYVVELEEKGVDLTGYRTTLKNMALALQQRERELRRRL